MDFLGTLAFSIWIGSELWISLRERGSVHTNQDRHSKKVFVLCVAAAIVVGLFGPRPAAYTIFWQHRTMELIGTVTIIAGVMLRVWSVLILGTFFRTTVMTQKGQRIIQTGPYTFIRHPSYLAVFITALGAGLYLNNLLTLIVMEVLLAIGIMHRVRTEEEVLEKEFGEEYQHYKQKTKRLVPFVY